MPTKLSDSVAHVLNNHTAKIHNMETWNFSARLSGELGQATFKGWRWGRVSKYPPLRAMLRLGIP